MATAVARSEYAVALKDARRAIRRTVLNVSKALARSGNGMRLVRCQVAIGIVCPASMIWSHDEGVRVSERMGRFFFIGARERLDLMLPEWAIAKWTVTRMGVGILDSWSEGAYSAAASALLATLKKRSARWASVYASLPVGATIGDAVKLYGESIVEGCVSHGLF